MIVGEDAVKAALVTPPPTRAKTRSSFLHLNGQSSVFHSWHIVSFREEDKLKLIMMPNPASEEYFVSGGDDWRRILREGGER